jgi:hypothetical protein
VPASTEDIKDLIKPLNKLLAAKDRLANALAMTEQAWPYTHQCWIDQLNGLEPTKLLEAHRLPPPRPDDL